MLNAFQLQRISTKLNRHQITCRRRYPNCCLNCTKHQVSQPSQLNPSNDVTEHGIKHTTEIPHSKFSNNTRHSPKLSHFPTENISVNLKHQQLSLFSTKRRHHKYSLHIFHNNHTDPVRNHSPTTQNLQPHTFQLT